MSRVLVVVWIVCGVLFFGCSEEDASPDVVKSEIVIGLNPSERSENTQQNADLLADLIAQKSGLPVKMFVAQDYSGLVEALRAKTVDFAFFAPISYVYAERIADARVLLKAQRYGSPYYFGSIIVRANSPYRTLEDLRGKQIAWVDPSSSSGHIFPKAGLIEKGIDPEEFFARQTFAGGHDAVLLAVINGTIDAGATFANDTLGKSGSWTQLEEGAFGKQIRPIFFSRPIPADNLATSSYMLEKYPEIVQKVTNAVEHMHEDSIGAQVMRSMYHVDAMVPATSADYDPVRDAADLLNLDITGEIKVDNRSNTLYSWIFVGCAVLWGIVMMSLQVLRRRGRNAENSAIIEDVPSSAVSAVSSTPSSHQFQLDAVSVLYHEKNGGEVLALDNMSLSINAGEFVAIVGPSGAGKSTLLRVLNGSVKPAKGRYSFCGNLSGNVEGENLRTLRQRVGFIFQNFNLVPGLSVLNNVITGRLAYIPQWRSLIGMFPENEKKRAIDCLTEVGLAEKAASRTADLSGGQQQRVAIARVLAQEPDAILADEPTASLDPVLAESILSLLADINENHGITVIANLHSTDLARRFAKRIVGMRSGNVVFDGTPDQLTEDVLGTIYADVQKQSASDG